LENQFRGVIREAALAALLAGRLLTAARATWRSLGDVISLRAS
jgi:hypothetical protein